MSKGPSWGWPAACDRSSQQRQRCPVQAWPSALGCRSHLLVSFRLKLCLQHQLARLPSLMQPFRSSWKPFLPGVFCLIMHDPCRGKNRTKRPSVLGSSENLGPGRWGLSRISRNSNSGILYKVWCFAFDLILSLLPEVLFWAQRRPCLCYIMVNPNQGTPLDCSVPWFTHLCK